MMPVKPMPASQAANDDNADSAANELRIIRDALCHAPELHAKTRIQPVADLVNSKPAAADVYGSPGDDCAAFASGAGYQLLAIEGMLPWFVKNDPWAAGWSAVMANVSDVAAMGGRATSVVNAYWHHDQAQADLIMQGIQNACDVFGITLAGGHTNMSMSHQASLAVAVMGFATHLLSCRHLQPGQPLYMAVDLNGQWHGDNNYWNVLSGKQREQVRSMWDLLPQLAEAGLVTAAKDISNGGVLGTLLMMLELNSLGVRIDIDAIPRPEDEVDVIRWLKAFQSYGFLLTGPEQHSHEVEQYFDTHGLTCKIIGTITEEPAVIFGRADASLEFWNLGQTPLTGMSLAKRGQ
ncbi:MAG: sll0787 family AIR synthase-like protein [Gammaproteobacteria bacterium]|jgi:AIR synthase-related protein